MSETLLEARDISVSYRTPAGWLHAVDGVDLTLARGETIGLVGESGCGKSSLARALVGLETRRAGTLTVAGEAVHEDDARAWRCARRVVQMIFQDPTASLDPRLSVGAQLDEALYLCGVGAAAARQERASDLLARVALPASIASRFPHELSGGQRQRVCIARALAVSPRVLICDEAVSALDVSVRAQILNLLATLQQREGLALLLVSHDLAVVRQLAARVVVMYLGQIVEEGAADGVFAAPRHPYTRLLLAAASGMSRVRCGPPALTDAAPDALHPPEGCRFHPRCSVRVARCSVEVPRLIAGKTGIARCLRDEGKGAPDTP